ncbi:hypothetical protein ACSBR2_040095 [Camellia fascicularis]
MDIRGAIYICYIYRPLKSLISFMLEAAVLDLVADDSGGIQKQKSRFHGISLLSVKDVLFFAKSVELLKICGGERVVSFYPWLELILLICLGVKIKTEGGAKVTANKTGVYKRWKERSHNKISLKGSSYEGNAEESKGFSEWLND